MCRSTCRTCCHGSLWNEQLKPLSFHDCLFCLIIFGACFHCSCSKVMDDAPIFNITSVQFINLVTHGLLSIYTNYNLILILIIDEVEEGKVFCLRDHVCSSVCFVLHIKIRLRQNIYDAAKSQRIIIRFGKIGLLTYRE